MKKSIILYFIYLSFGDIFYYQSLLAKDIKYQFKKNIKKVSKEQIPGIYWILDNMPESHLDSISLDFLLENSEVAYKARNNTPWGKGIPDKIFFEYVLPYSNLNERIDDWREDFYDRFHPMVKNLPSAYSASALLNQKIFNELGVIYSTERLKADQSPYESIETGTASCTGLSILLINACRSVSIPARFVGTPMWYNNSGNHSWVEIWDNKWHFTGAAEPTGDSLNIVWFSDFANNAIKTDMKYGIFAATWAATDKYFPLSWMPDNRDYYAIEVTDRYKTDDIQFNLVPIRICVLDSMGKRKKVTVGITFGNDFQQGISKDESFDANDHLIFMIPRNQRFVLETTNQKIENIADEEKLIKIKL